MCPHNDSVCHLNYSMWHPQWFDIPSLWWYTLIDSVRRPRVTFTMTLHVLTVTFCDLSLCSVSVCLYDDSMYPSLWFGISSSRLCDLIFVLWALKKPQCDLNRTFLSSQSLCVISQCFSVVFTIIYFNADTISTCIQIDSVCPSLWHCMTLNTTCVPPQCLCTVTLCDIQYSTVCPQNDPSWHSHWHPLTLVASCVISQWFVISSEWVCGPLTLTCVTS